MRIQFKHVTFSYKAGKADKQPALRDIDLTCETDRIIGICGATGSGKSTFIRHLNGILKPTAGQILIDGTDLHQSKAALRRLRQRIGMTIQFPERQFFGRTVWEELAYTLERRQLPPQEIEGRILSAAQALCFDLAALRDRSPFALSRADQRLLGIAVMLTLQPDLIMLDEPTAGMDRKHAAHVLSLLRSVHRDRIMRLMLASHDLELLLNYTETLIILRSGRLIFHGSTRQAVNSAELLQQNGLALPPLHKTLYLLRRKYPQLPTDVNNVDAAIAEILKRKNTS
jgi:energy-coupling factor transport system ATP-binding protein